MAAQGYKPMGSPGASFNPQVTPNNVQGGGIQNALMQRFAPGAGTFSHLPQQSPMQVPPQSFKPPMQPGTGFQLPGTQMPNPQMQGPGLAGNFGNQGAFSMPPTQVPGQGQNAPYQGAPMGGLSQGMQNPFARMLNN